MKMGLYVPWIPDGNTTPVVGPLYLIAVLEQAGVEARLFDARIDRQGKDWALMDTDEEFRTKP